MARLEDGPGGAAGRKNPEPGRFAQNLPLRHRVALTADAAMTEAMVLVSIVTEQEQNRKDNKERAWRPSTVMPVAGGEAYHGGWGSQEEQWAEGMEDDMQGGGKEHQEMRRRCLETMEAAAVLGFDELRKRHIDDVEALFDRVHFSLESSSDDSGMTEGSGASLVSSGSCVAGLPIRTRVSRSGKACTEEGEDGLDPAAGFVASGGLDRRTVVDDGLIELMYHYGRCVGVGGAVLWRRLRCHERRREKPRLLYSLLRPRKPFRMCSSRFCLRSCPSSLVHALKSFFSTLRIPCFR